jgi:hypothetical protein
LRIKKEDFLNLDLKDVIKQDQLDKQIMNFQYKIRLYTYWREVLNGLYIRKMFERYLMY